MDNRPRLFRRLAATALIVSLAAGLAACSRKTNILTPAVQPPYTWTNGIQHLIADRSEGTKPTGCTGCHHPDTNIPDWTNYNTVVGDSGFMALRLSTPGDQMRSFLNPGEPDIIVAWIHSGAPY